jgi:hypothetical protein
MDFPPVLQSINAGTMLPVPDSASSALAELAKVRAAANRKPWSHNRQKPLSVTGDFNVRGLESLKL